VGFIHSPGKLSVSASARAQQRRGEPRNRPKTPTISDNMAARPQDTRGNQMELQLIIGAGIAATGIITALLLRWQNDPLEEDIRAALQYESKQQKIAKAIRK
jgi:hypothetical protein